MKSLADVGITKTAVSLGQEIEGFRGRNGPAGGGKGGGGKGFIFAARSGGGCTFTIKAQHGVHFIQSHSFISVLFLPFFSSNIIAI